MPRSSASFISYDLRPSKQSERRVLVDILKLAGDCGHPISSYRYVGMGANRFYDFLMMHKYLGVCNMISLEHDRKMFKRAEFNVPYKFISVQFESAASFAANDVAPHPTIYWLDYDGGLGTDVTGDISSFAANMKLGDFCFVTTFGGPPRFMEHSSDDTRLAWLQDNLGHVAGSVTLEDVQLVRFSSAVHKVLLASLRNAFSVRRDGIFVVLLQVEYADSLPMVTVGGAFLTQGQAIELRLRFSSLLPFLDVNGERLYEIKSLHLTARERALFDRAVTSRNARSSEARKLISLGFTRRELAAYKELLRYLPRYVETIV